MTSKISSGNKAAGGLLRFTIRKNIGIVILTTVFMLLICPGSFLISDNTESVFQNNNTLFSHISTMSVALSVVMSGIAAVSCFVNFFFLFSKRATDAYHSLPITRARLLLTRFLASVLPMLVPVLVCYLSLAIILLTHNARALVPAALTGALFTALAVFLSAAVSLLFMICAGSIFDLLISFAVVNVGLLLIYFILENLCSSFLYGHPGATGESLARFSPFLYTFTRQYTGMRAVYDHTPLLSVCISLLVIVLLFAVFIAADILLYNRRKSEKSGESYAYRAVYVLTSVIAGFVCAYGLGAIFGTDYNSVFWVFAVLGGLLATVTLGAVSDRGFKTMKTSLLYGGCALLLLAATTGAIKTDLFGYTSHIPSKDKVQNVSVRFDGEEFNFDGDIQDVLSLHQYMAENRLTPDVENVEYRYLYLTYTMKNGSTLTRYYLFDVESIPEALNAVYRSDEHAESVRDTVLAEIPGVQKAYTLYYSNTESDRWMELTPAEVRELMEVYIPEMQRYGFSYNSSVEPNTADLEIELISLPENGDLTIDYTFYSLKFNQNYTATLGKLNDLMEKYIAEE